MKVKLVLKNMTLGPNDYIMFRDGVRDDSPLIAKYADCASGEIRLYSTDQYLLVNFVSDSSEPGNGFQLDYETVESSKETKRIRGQRGRLPVQPLGYVMSTNVIFRRAEVFVKAKVCLPRRPHAGQPRSDAIFSFH